MNSNVSLSLSLSFENSRIFSIYSIYRQIVDFFSAGTNGGGEKKKKKKGSEERRASGHKEMRLTRRNVSKGKLKPNEVCVTLNRSLWRR